MAGTYVLVVGFAALMAYLFPGRERPVLLRPRPMHYDARNGRWVPIGPTAKPPHNDHYPDF